MRKAKFTIKQNNVNFVLHFAQNVAHVIIFS